MESNKNEGIKCGYVMDWNRDLSNQIGNFIDYDTKKSILLLVLDPSTTNG